MAKKAKAFDGLVLKSAPKTLPDGLKIYRVKGTVAEGSGDDRVTKVGIIDAVGPELSNEGVIAYQKYLMANDVPEKDVGEYVAKCLLSAIASGVRNSLTPKTIGDGQLVIPAAPNTRTVDPAAAAGDGVVEFIRVHGRGPNATELKEIYASVGLAS